MPRGQAAAALRPGLFAETVARRQLQARAGQVVRTDRTALCAMPPRQLTRPARRDLWPFSRGRGIRNPVRDGLPGHGDALLPATSQCRTGLGPRAPGRLGCSIAADRTTAVTGSGVTQARLLVIALSASHPRNSASTSARRYRGLPASLRTSGSRPRRAQLATAAEVTRNKDATCLRVIRSSPIRLPVIAAAAHPRAAAGPAPDAARPHGYQRHHIHRVPAVSLSELIRDSARHPTRLLPGTAWARYRTAWCRLQ